MQLPPRSMILNAIFTSCGLAPRPHIWSHNGSEAVALFTMTVSISGWSNPVVAIKTLLRIASGVLANHSNISARSGESASRWRELNPASTNALLTAIECSTLQLKIIVLRPRDRCLYTFKVDSIYFGSLNAAAISAWSKSPAFILSLALLTICGEEYVISGHRYPCSINSGISTPQTMSSK